MADERTAAEKKKLPDIEFPPMPRELSVMPDGEERNDSGKQFSQEDPVQIEYSDTSRQDTIEQDRGGDSGEAEKGSMPGQEGKGGGDSFGENLGLLLKEAEKQNESLKEMLEAIKELEVTL